MECPPVLAINSEVSLAVIAGVVRTPRRMRMAFVTDHNLILDML